MSVTFKDVWRDVGWRSVTLSIGGLTMLCGAGGYILGTTLGGHLPVLTGGLLLAGGFICLSLYGREMERQHARHMREGQELNDRIDARIAELERQHQQVLQ